MMSLLDLNYLHFIFYCWLASRNSGEPLDIIISFLTFKKGTIELQYFNCSCTLICNYGYLTFICFYWGEISAFCVFMQKNFKENGVSRFWQHLDDYFDVAVNDADESNV